MMNFKVKSGPSWVQKNTIIYSILGSRAYGIETPESDWDFQGVAVPPMRDFLSFRQQFSQTSWKDGNCEATIFGISKYVKLAADCNPNVLEILWLPEDLIIFKNESGEDLLRMRDLFMSKKIKHTFSGYAHSQLKRIKTHRKWILNPPKNKPTREEYGLPEHSTLPKDHMAAIEAALEF